MINFTKSYKTSDNQVFTSIDEAKIHELETLFTNINLTHGSTVGSGLATEIAKFIMDKKDIIVDILTTNPNSKPKARVIHGGTKKRPSITKPITNTPTPPKQDESVPNPVVIENTDNPLVTNVIAGQLV